MIEGTSRAEGGIGGYPAPAGSHELDATRELIEESTPEAVVELVDTVYKRAWRALGTLELLPGGIFQDGALENALTHLPEEEANALRMKIELAREIRQEMAVEGSLRKQLGTALGLGEPDSQTQG